MIWQLYVNLCSKSRKRINFLSFNTLKSLKGRLLFFLSDISQTDHEIMQGIFCLIRISDGKAIQS